MTVSSRAARFLPVAMLVAAGLLILGPHVPYAGLHMDDFGFHWNLPKADFAGAWQQAKGYVPGRNLYILYYWGIYKALGPSPVRLHLFGMLLDILNVCLAYALCRRMLMGRATGLLIAGLFLVYPNHGETHFWTASIAMNLLSTTLILLSFLAIGCRRLAVRLRFPLSLVLFALALFDYDQAFFMWVPLLFYAVAFRAPEAPPKRWLVLAGAGAVLLCATHFFLRTASPFSSTGSPFVRLGSVGLRIAESLFVSVVPMTKFPLWTALQSPAGGAVPTVLVLLVLSGCWVRLVASLWNEEDDAGPSRKAAVLAGLWFFCAYLPNYFWHISPRHNYLPSLGFLMLLALAGKTLSESRPRLRAALSCGAFALFGLSASAAVSEGYGWTKSAELLARFRAEAPLLLPARPQAIFLMDAPTSVYRAPAFDQPGEHQTLFADATGHLPGDGDLTFTPTRTGAFFRNQPALHGGDLRWLPYGAMSVVAFRQDGGFRCASRLRLSLPDGGISEMPLSASPGCREPFGMEVRVWLVSSRSLPRSSRRPLFTAANGASLVGLSAERQAAFLEVELVWQAPQGAVKDFASFIRLYDHAGKLVFEPAYPVLSAGQRRPDALWPVSNDLHPASRWKKDAVVSERYQLACAGPLPGGPLMAELTLLEKSESGPWRKVGVYRAAL